MGNYTSYVHISDLLLKEEASCPTWSLLTYLVVFKLPVHLLLTEGTELTYANSDSQENWYTCMIAIYTSIYSYIIMKNICMYRCTAYFELTLQQASAILMTFFLASFNSMQKINKCQMCINKCRRRLCCLLWLNCEKPITFFLA